MGLSTLLAQTGAPTSAWDMVFAGTLPTKVVLITLAVSSARVSANLLASEMVLKPAANIDAVAFNVGTGVGTSVNRLADVLESIAEVRPGRVYREALRDPVRLERRGGLRRAGGDTHA